MKLKKIYYPSDEFYSFADGFDVSNDILEEWINEGIENVKKQLENGVECPYSYHASGNAIVFVHFSQDVEDNVFDDCNYFEVVVAKGYEEGSFFIENIKEDAEPEQKEICSNIYCSKSECCEKNIRNIYMDMCGVDIKKYRLNSDGHCEHFTLKDC